MGNVVLLRGIIKTGFPVQSPSSENSPVVNIDIDGSDAQICCPAGEGCQPFSSDEETVIDNLDL